jgi:hypothetical protein
MESVNAETGGVLTGPVVRVTVAGKPLVAHRVRHGWRVLYAGNVEEQRFLQDALSRLFLSPYDVLHLSLQIMELDTAAD